MVLTACRRRGHHNFVAALAKVIYDLGSDTSVWKVPMTTIFIFLFIGFAFLVVLIAGPLPLAVAIWKLRGGVSCKNSRSGAQGTLAADEKGSR